MVLARRRVTSGDALNGVADVAAGKRNGNPSPFRAASFPDGPADQAFFLFGPCPGLFWPSDSDYLVGREFAGVSRVTALNLEGGVTDAKLRSKPLAGMVHKGVIDRGLRPNQVRRECRCGRA